MYDDHPIEAWRFNISDEGGGRGEKLFRTFHNKVILKYI